MRALARHPTPFMAISSVAEQEGHLMEMEATQAP